MDLVVVLYERKENDEEELDCILKPKVDIDVTGNDAITFPAIYKPDGTNVICILFNGPQKDDVWVHEADHFANMMFYILGIELDLNNDEAHAYLLEWAFKQIKSFYLDYILP